MCLVESKPHGILFVWFRNFKLLSFGEEAEEEEREASEVAQVIIASVTVLKVQSIMQTIEKTKLLDVCCLFPLFKGSSSNEGIVSSWYCTFFGTDLVKRYVCESTSFITTAWLEVIQRFFSCHPGLNAREPISSRRGRDDIAQGHLTREDTKQTIV